jgi:hypothetical protein
MAPRVELFLALFRSLARMDPDARAAISTDIEVAKLLFEKDA